MTGQEKITLNLNAMDLARLDYLAEQGFYSSRSDFIRTAVRNQLRKHEAVISDEVLTRVVGAEAEAGKVKTIGGIGVITIGHKELEGYAASGKKLKLFILGTLILKKEVTADLLSRVVESARVYGALRGPREAVDYIRRLKGVEE